MIWKEAHIKLKANREYCHDMSTEGNCVIVLNRDTIVRFGESSGNYERTIKPNGVGVLIRPFPLNQVFIMSETDTTIKIIETKEDKITDQFLHQHERPIDTNIVSTIGLKASDLNLDVNKNAGVNIANIPSVNVTDTVGLRPTDLNIDANKNIGVNIANTPNTNIISTVGLKPADLNIDVNKNVGVLINNEPKIDQTDVYGILSTTQSSTNNALSVTLDTTTLGRTLINVFVESSIAADFIISLSNDNIAFKTKHTITLAQPGNKLYSFSDNAYRYVKVETIAIGNHTIEITATR